MPVRGNSDFLDERIYGIHGHFNVASASLVFIAYVPWHAPWQALSYMNYEDRPSVLPFAILV